VPKLCLYCQKYPIFSHGFCKFHQNKRTDEKYKKQMDQKRSKKALLNVLEARSSSRRYNIPPMSKKRQNMLVLYKAICKEIDAEQPNCFFCGRRGGGDHHHLKGRRGKLLTEKKWIVRAHYTCHTLKYHRLPVEDLMMETWYPAFIGRLKLMDSGLYDKELRRQGKITC